MITSHKYKFIFIKTAKTAGTSIEVDFNKILGDSDISTPIFPPVSGHKPKNFKQKWPKSLFKKDFGNSHMSASEVKNIIGNRIFQEYFVFCVERELVDKCISHYSMIRNSPHHNKKTKNISFDEYILNRKFPIDTDKYVGKNGKLIVNKILKYENLQQELNSIGLLLGFNIHLTSNAKNGFREFIEPTNLQKSIIYKEFEESNKHTGYSLMSSNE